MSIRVHVACRHGTTRLASAFVSYSNNLDLPNTRCCRRICRARSARAGGGRSDVGGNSPEMNVHSRRPKEEPMKLCNNKQYSIKPELPAAWPWLGPQILGHWHRASASAGAGNSPSDYCPYPPCLGLRRCRTPVLTYYYTVRAGRGQPAITRSPGRGVRLHQHCRPRLSAPSLDAQRCSESHRARLLPDQSSFSSLLTVPLLLFLSYQIVITPLL